MNKIFALAAISVFIACTKHASDITVDTPTATINVLQPTSGAVYHYGDSVTISATAVATATIHGYDVAIKKGNDTTTYYFEHVHDHNANLVVNKKWKNTINGSFKVEAELTFYLDHDGHTAVKRVPFSVE